MSKTTVQRFTPFNRALTGEEQYIFGEFCVSHQRINGEWREYIDSYNTHMPGQEMLRMITEFMRQEHRPSRLEHTLLEIGDIRTAVYFSPEMYERFCRIEAPFTVAVIETSQHARNEVAAGAEFTIEDFLFQPVARIGDFVYAVSQEDLDIATTVRYMTRPERTAAIRNAGYQNVNALLTMDEGIHESFRNLNQASVVGIMQPRPEWRAAIIQDNHDNPGTRFSIGCTAEFILPAGAQAL